MSVRIDRLRAGVAQAGRALAGSGLVDAPLAPTSELPVHLAIYRHYDAAAVVHTHPPMATAVACVADELPCFHYALLALGGDVRVARYATFGTADLAASVVAALATYRVAGRRPPERS